jgi:hypothetical protein
MFVQGIILSCAYALLPIDHAAFSNGLLFAGIMGVFFWSTHVLSAMAKRGATRTRNYLIMETIYLIGQFVLFGLLISGVYQFV